ncbi:MAG: DNA helicase, partial [Candidatus Brocadiae bacterium]|nr:DNA helicase [Candidatus Brocadiia bacterium]
MVTFNLSQQRLIEDLLEVARRQNPLMEAWFETAAAEPVFVKNLESVQGDERDVILFSLGYGPDVQGHLSMNFGPLNREGGQRRLNVAITRARQEVVVFSSLASHQIDLARVRGRGGVADLKSFLDYAERGPAALAERQLTAGSPGPSTFERQIAQALGERGWTVHHEVGCSGYRVDLAVLDPDQPDRYLLGLECDGASYHQAGTARDREVLRQAILHDLGWRLHRVWCTDWWERPGEELARIEAALE